MLAALSLLHNAPAMISLNPLVQSWEPISDEAAATFGLRAPDPPPRGAAPPQRVTYRITDMLPLPLSGGRYSSSTTYVARFEKHWDRLVTQVRAGWGVESAGVWAVRQEKGEGEGETGLVLEESVSVTCPFLLRPFVEETMRKAHRELGEAFVERLRREEELKVARWEREEKKMRESEMGESA